jgi:hypothetical protein
MVSLLRIPSDAVVLMYVGSEIIEVTSSPEPEGGRVFIPHLCGNADVCPCTLQPVLQRNTTLQELASCPQAKK